MVDVKNQKQLSKFNTKINNNNQLVAKEAPPTSCSLYPPGSEIAVFCQVQKFPRIVVLPAAIGELQPTNWGYLKTLELNQCVNVGQTNQSCGFACCDEPPFKQVNGRIVKNEKFVDKSVVRNSFGQVYNPNPPFPPVPIPQQIQCYNFRSALNQCNVNKRNFYFNTNSYNSVLGGA